LSEADMPGLAQRITSNEHYKFIRHAFVGILVDRSIYEGSNSLLISAIAYIYMV